jgi:hypothetical protein
MDLPMTRVSKACNQHFMIISPMTGTREHHNATRTVARNIQPEFETSKVGFS